MLLSIVGIALGSHTDINVSKREKALIVFSRIVGSFIAFFSHVSNIHSFVLLTVRDLEV